MNEQKYAHQSSTFHFLLSGLHLFATKTDANVYGGREKKQF